MDVLRTPEERFAQLSDYPFESNFVTLNVGRPGPPGPLRMHYVDEGPRDARPVVLLHGQPTWSYLYRHVIAALAARGHRVVAPDHIGFGKSDKLKERTHYTYASHCAWLLDLLAALEVQGATLVVQDWGGPIGLCALSQAPHRFDRVLATNTLLHPAPKASEAVPTWAVLDSGATVSAPAALLDYLAMVERTPELLASMFVRYATTSELSNEVLDAYDAPFPDEAHKTGLRQFTALIPLTANDPGSRLGRDTWRFLETWDRPFLTAFSDGDEATRGWDKVFQAHVPGCGGQPHVIIEGGGHFIQEDRPGELAAVIDAFVRSTS
jgi:haloalkane dehalogenase